MTPERKRMIAVLPGDDSAPEAIYPTLEVLQSMGLPLEWRLLPDGEALSDMPPEERERLIREAVDQSDSLLFGATSGKTGGVGYLRWGRDTFANVRPIRLRTGFKSPLRNAERVDYVIVRENIEDLYLGIEGELADLEAAGFDLRPWRGAFDTSPQLRTSGSPAARGEGRYAVKVITRENTERLARFACELAVRRKERGYTGKVTCSSKYNVLSRSDGFFRQIVEGVVRQYGELCYEEFIVDDLARRLVSSPQEFDVIVLPNLYGDILSDVGAATIGGLGLAPSGCYGVDYAYFEPVHGTAPDISGRHVINPTATMLSAVMMLEYVGLEAAAKRLETAIEETVASGEYLTPDQGGSATSDEFARAVQSRI